MKAIKKITTATTASGWTRIFGAALFWCIVEIFNESIGIKRFLLSMLFSTKDNLFNCKMNEREERKYFAYWWMRIKNIFWFQNLHFIMTYLCGKRIFSAWKVATDFLSCFIFETKFSSIFQFSFLFFCYSYWYWLLKHHRLSFINLTTMFFSSTFQQMFFEMFGFLRWNMFSTHFSFSLKREFFNIYHVICIFFRWNFHMRL